MAGQPLSGSEWRGVWNLLLAPCSGRVLGEARGGVNGLMLVSDAEGLSDPEAAAGGLLSSTPWGDLAVAVPFVSGSSWSAMWNWCDATLGSILWAVWSERRDFLWSVPPALGALAAGASELPLLLLLMLSLFSFGPALGF